MSSDRGPTKTRPYERVCVVGAGAWGTALAGVARRAGREVTVWGRDAEVLAAIGERRENPRYLPGIELPAGLRGTTEIDRALDGAEAVLLVTPSVTVRDMCRAMAPHLAPGAPLALCAKGIERGTGLLLAEAAGAELPGRPIGALSGPTFAHETAMGHPTAATIAFPFSYDDRLDPTQSTAARMAVSMSTESFRPYVSDDLIGVEIGGAVKNVIAIACGMMTGAGFAENTRAALITRGMNEMKKLAEALGGRRETVTGLSGAGDLVLTCSSQTSRNMSLGVQLGRGLKREDCFEGRPVVVEGEVNAVSVVQLARRIGVAMPICEAVHAILHEGVPLGVTFSQIWSRPITGEPAGLDITLSHHTDREAIDAYAERFQ